MGNIIIMGATFMGSYDPSVCENSKQPNTTMEVLATVWQEGRPFCSLLFLTFPLLLFSSPVSSPLSSPPPCCLSFCSALTHSLMSMLVCMSCCAPGIGTTNAVHGVHGTCLAGDAQWPCPQTWRLILPNQVLQSPLTFCAAGLEYWAIRMGL